MQYKMLYKFFFYLPYIIINWIYKVTFNKLLTRCKVLTKNKKGGGWQKKKFWKGKKFNLKMFHVW